MKPLNDGSSTVENGRPDSYAHMAILKFSSSCLEVLNMSRMSLLAGVARPGAARLGAAGRVDPELAEGIPAMYMYQWLQTCS